MAPNELDQQTFAYNDHGDVISQVSESSHTEYSFGEEEDLHQNRIALARIARKRTFAINTIRTEVGSRRLLKPSAVRFGV